MECWGDHERVNVISEVIKSSDPEQINFFAQCLIQRYWMHLLCAFYLCSKCMLMFVLYSCVDPSKFMHI